MVRAESPDDDGPSGLTILLADWGFTYTGPSSPHWYGPNDFANLFRRAPASATAADVIRDLGLVPPKDLTGPAHAILGDRATALLRVMQARNKPVPAEKIGQLGPGVYDSCSGYAKKLGVYHERGGGRVPFCIEAHVACRRPDKRANADIDGVLLVVNRSASLAKIVGRFTGDAFSLHGGGAQIKLESGQVPAGIFTIYLSLISPHVTLTNDGKSPTLVPYAKQIAEVAKKAMCMAHRRMERPAGKKVTQKAAASSGMLEAYEHASGASALSPNARQVMYAARGRILEQTGLTRLDSAYFTQTLLPDFEADHPKETAHWDVIYDARGTLIEPHTGTEVALGTIEVRNYVADSDGPRLQGPAIHLTSRDRWNTLGPENRFKTVLFIEKEGFHRQIEQAKLQQRFDVGLMTTKGMSVIASRRLLNDLSARVAEGKIDRILVAHDFDVSGFGIFATLSGDSRRYKFTTTLPVYDIGLRLSDIEEMGLQSETVELKATSWPANARRLAKRGVTNDELAFLRPDAKNEGRRVELNAMTAPVFIDFLERKLTQYGAGKVVPPETVLAEHATRILAREAAALWLEKMPAKALQVPDGLADRVRALLAADATLAWDDAVALLLKVP
jgi:hypothetical protein